MRLIALLLMGVLASSPAAAQQAGPPSTAESSSSSADMKPTTRLPVSLDKIRDGLERPTAMFTGPRAGKLNQEPNFRVEIAERGKIEELLATLTFKSGPVPAEGIYGFEQQRMMFPAVDNPLAQPLCGVQSRTAADDPGREPRREIPRRAGSRCDYQVGSRTRRGGGAERSRRGGRRILRGQAE